MSQEGQEQNKAVRALRVTLSRAIQREWVKGYAGLLPELVAALKASGGPVEVEISDSKLGESAGRRGLRTSCVSALAKLGPDHRVSGHVQAILKMIGNDG